MLSLTHIEWVGSFIDRWLKARRLHVSLSRIFYVSIAIIFKRGPCSTIRSTVLQSDLSATILVHGTKLNISYLFSCAIKGLGTRLSHYCLSSSIVSVFQCATHRGFGYKITVDSSLHLLPSTAIQLALAFISVITALMM